MDWKTIYIYGFLSIEVEIWSISTTMSSHTKSMKFLVNLFFAHIIIFLTSSVQLACEGAPANARVKSFPGYNGDLKSEIYAG